MSAPWRAVGNLASDLVLAQAAPPEKQPLLWRLDPVSRAKVLMALLGLILIGLLLLILVRSWARWTRREARRALRPTQPGDDRWYKAPLAPGERPPGVPGEGDAEKRDGDDPSPAPDDPT